MAKKEDLQDEQKLISMSAEGAKKLAAGFKSSSSALKDVIDALNEVEKEIDNSNKEAKTLGDHFKETKSFSEALGDSLGKN